MAIFHVRRTIHAAPANVKRQIDHLKIDDWLLRPSDSRTWHARVLPNNTRWFDTYDCRTLYPGHHFIKYKNPFGDGNHDSTSHEENHELLTSFLKPSTDEEELMELSLIHI